MRRNSDIIEELVQATPDDPRHTHLYISWSALKRYEECHARQMLNMQGKKSPMTDGRVFLPGTVADNAMRAWLNQDDPQRDTLADFAEEQFAKHTGPESEYTIKWRGDPNVDRQLVRNTVRNGLMRLEPWLFKNVLPHGYQPEATGASFIGVEGLDGQAHRVQMHLAIDILVKPEDSGYQIYDLKMTTSEQYTAGATLAQLTFYKIALAGHLGIPTSEVTKLAFVTPLLKNLEQEVVAGPDEVREMMARITAYCQGLWTGQFATKRVSDWDCTRCEVQGACPKFATARTSGGRISLLQTASLRRARAGA